MERDPLLQKWINNIREDIRPGSSTDGKCVFCGSVPGHFKDAISLKEWDISQICQKCQDDTFK